MTTYAQGDAMGSVSVKYVYSGDDYQMNGTDGDGENYDLCFITMKNGRMDKLQVFEDGEKTDLLQFNYNADGKIETIDVPYEQAQGVARFVYDSKKNPTELQVSASKLGKKDEQYDDIFCELGPPTATPSTTRRWGVWFPRSHTLRTTPRWRNSVTTMRSRTS